MYGMKIGTKKRRVPGLPGAVNPMILRTLVLTHRQHVPDKQTNSCRLLTQNYVICLLNRS